jgi:hypothetical protein
MTTKVKRSCKTHVLSTLGIGLWLMSSPSFAACLMKARQVDGVGTARTLMLAPEREVAEYAALGFVRATCPADMSLVRQYVERLCAVPGGEGTALRVANTDLIGRSRESVCASARAALAESGG